MHEKKNTSQIHQFCIGTFSCGTITVIIVPSTFVASVVSARDFYVLQMPPLQIMYTTKAIKGKKRTTV